MTRVQFWGLKDPSVELSDPWCPLRTGCGAARTLNVSEQMEVGDPQIKNGVPVFEEWPRENLWGEF